MSCRQVAAGAVICLQEVSTDWAAKLHVHFAERGYHMMHMGYGNRFDGYMGVALAFSCSKFRLQNARIERVADLRNWPRPAPLGFRARTRAWAAGLWRALRKERRPLDPVTDAKRRANQLIMARLECRESGAAFCVGTYHMPCQFRVPVVMVTHMALALRELQLWAGAAPLIFCGDFNVKPGDSAYRLVTEGELEQSDEHYPEPTANGGWEPRIQYAMRSAYADALGAEPELTNWAFTRGSEGDFKDTLDYIFVSDGVDVAGVKPIRVTDGPLPTEAEPSDHVLIAADLSVQDRGNAANSR